MIISNDVIQRGNNTTLAQEHQLEECRCEMEQGHSMCQFGGTLYKSNQARSSSGNAIIFIPSSLFHFRAHFQSIYLQKFLCVALLLCHKYDTCKKHVYLFSEEPRISIAWEAQLIQQERLGELVLKKERKENLKKPYLTRLSGPKEGLKITVDIRCETVVCW